MDIKKFGKYPEGLSRQEILEYLIIESGFNEHEKVNNLLNRFYRVAGVNTCPIAKDGTRLMYRHDVERFAGVILLGKRTYFD